MKRRILMLLSVLGLGLSLCACGGADSTENTDMAQDNDVQAVSDGAQGGYSVADGAIMDCEEADLDGNTVRLGDIISQNNVTMVNIWGTFCGPCLSEMPGLEELYRKYGDDGFCIIGLTCDIIQNGKTDEGTLELAKSIRDEFEITYPIVAQSAELYELMPVSAVPATFFFDKNGKALGGVYMGANTKEAWDKIIKGKLEEEN